MRVLLLAISFMFLLAGSAHAFGKAGVISGYDSWQPMFDKRKMAYEFDGESGMVRCITHKRGKPLKMHGEILANVGKCMTWSYGTGILWSDEIAVVTQEELITQMTGKENPVIVKREFDNNLKVLNVYFK